ncbi:8478ce57-0e0f-4443-9313-668c123ad2c2 [Thermothielavioides terrestris]|uniref:Uncharacterized protein n=2 Tax=Thermothielavioides terrestris TaxID=2587410 RepID=G2QWC8_THETT|nr:uncharacterized protein THITE_2109523 [Thermothielavioides terrestris NRRL 8126]AEO63903.1 hypothetical protein THITE_2109523 [Thermothielavioides terrestris NRRL 8126]SPQ23369.1 8478ce57-0e0f-4443-9313-668c123ad2c2 [Thermothielavioides terrestris]
MSYQGHSNVGFPSLYESQNQRNVKQSEVDELTRHTGENVKGFMPKGQAREVNRLHEQEVHRHQAENMKKDPTLAARLHGNKPAKGAMIDKELQEEDEAQLRKKGDAVTGKKM